jgi:hypothetical protein
MKLFVTPDRRLKYAKGPLLPCIDMLSLKGHHEATYGYSTPVKDPFPMHTYTLHLWPHDLVCNRSVELARDMVSPSFNLYRPTGQDFSGSHLAWMFLSPPAVRNSPG